MDYECVLCYEESNYIGITECNHGPFCYRCIYKMRVISKNNNCPICKSISKQVVISEKFETFGEFSEKLYPDKQYSDVFYAGQNAKKQFQKLTEYKCFVKIGGKPCRHEKKFPNIAFLKKHLKEEHKRSFCDVCLDKKTCVLEEQTLYTQAQLTRHLERGDLDECGNIVFMHPYCTFCKKYFFDEEMFRVHINLQHFTCGVCGQQEKYRYYKDYQSLQLHYKISHYICPDKNCLAKKFIAFRTAEQLKVHKYQVHEHYSGKKIDGRELCNFHYQGHENEEQYIQIKDNEGVDMERQFLSLKKAKNRALGEADKQEDGYIDLRNFFPSGLEEDQHFREVFILKHHHEGEQKGEQERKKKNKKKKYIEKAELEKQKPQIAKQNKHFYLEELLLLRPLHLSRLRYDEFEDKLATILNAQDFKKIESWRNKYSKWHMKPEELISNFLDLMKKVSLRMGYEIFPHFIRTIQNDQAKYQLDHEYIHFLKKVQFKSKSLLSMCNKYSELFHKLLKQIEVNIQNRIIQGSLSIKKPIKREKQRLFQILGVLRRLKTEQMAKFKFANNFGVEGDTIDLVHDKIIKLDYENTQKRLDKIPEQEFLDLYVFIKYCYEAIKHSDTMHLAKNKINEHILEDFLFDRPELEKKYGQKKSQLKTLDQQIEYEKLEEQKNHKKQLKQMEKKNKNVGYHAQANFNLEDKSDFPDLVKEKKNKEKDDRRQNFNDVMTTAKQKPATYKKKINELFPTLDGMGSEEQKPKKEEVVVSEKREKQWWEKINEKKVVQEDEQKEIKVRKGKKKNQKWVTVKGLGFH